MSEAALVLRLEQWLRDQGMNTNIEVPWAGVYARGRQRRQGARWDLVAWNDQGRFLAVEVEGRYALAGAEQAAAMMPACEECYLAVPNITSGELSGFRAEYEPYGLGLIVIRDGGCEVAINAKLVTPIHLAMRAEMLRVAKMLPREGIEPGRRIIDQNCWRFTNVDTREASRIGLSYATSRFARSSLRKRR